MKFPPRLRLEPRPSRLACAVIVAVCSAMAVVVAVLQLRLAAALACGAIGVAVLVSSLRRCTRRDVPALLYVGIDRRIAVTERTGRSRAGSILDDSYVGSTLTTIVWRADGDPWWRPARTILFLRDSLPPDDFRRLRVVLRYGGATDDADTSGVEAG